jgi:hypothetical protein
MHDKVGYGIGWVGAALAGAWIIFAVWDTLIRQEIGLAPSSLSWFPLVSVLWAGVCMVVGVLVYLRRH